MILASLNDGFVPGALGAIGNLCLGGQVAFSPPMRASSSGVLKTTVQAVLGAAVQPVAGVTLYFQGWYRDRDFWGAAISRFSGSRSIEFR